MNCPKCGVATFVQSAGLAKEGDAVYSVLLFQCKNPQCSSYSTIVATKQIKQKFDEEVILCCSNVMAVGGQVFYQGICPQCHKNWLASNET